MVDSRPTWNNLAKKTGSGILGKQRKSLKNEKTQNSSGYLKKNSSKYMSVIGEDDTDRNYGDPLEYYVERQNDLETCAESQCNSAKVQLLFSKWSINL